MLAELGADRIAMDALAERAGVGKGTVFRRSGTPVGTTQIAPAILSLLGLSPGALQAVQTEHTRVLPGLGGTAAP
jgi:hypothetical protein